MSATDLFAFDKVSRVGCFAWFNDRGSKRGIVGIVDVASAPLNDKLRGVSYLLRVFIWDFSTLGNCLCVVEPGIKFAVVFE